MLNATRAVGTRLNAMVAVIVRCRHLANTIKTVP